MRVLAAVAMVVALRGFAQQPMGSVATKDAVLSGGLEVRGERTTLVSNANIQAGGGTTTVELDRGGTLNVCATSGVHLLHVGTGRSLLVGLDRGAVELHGASEKEDILLTPDIRFTMEAAGTFDLRVRVTANGDTCVENAGHDAPVLLLSETFSAAHYRVIPGQHVLFEHGRLTEVVDNEHSPCGCPTAASPAVLSANASPSERAAAAHPFPAAESVGLAETKPAVNVGVSGETNTQVTMSVSNTEAAPAAVKATNAPVVAAAPPEAPPPPKSVFHAIGRFFKRLFGGPKPAQPVQ